MVKCPNCRKEMYLHEGKYTGTLTWVCGACGRIGIPYEGVKS